MNTYFWNSKKILNKTANEKYKCFWNSKKILNKTTNEKYMCFWNSKNKYQISNFSILQNTICSKSVKFSNF